MIPNATFWRGRRVLVTGHTGFKGSWLSLWLTKMGAKVCGLSLEPATNPNLFAALDLPSILAEHHIADIASVDQCVPIVKKFNPQVMLHLAAQSLVLESYEDPIRTYATNVMGTAHLLQIARALPELAVVCVVTSDKCYENLNWEWGYRENDRLGGDDPYSNSKACAELVTHAMRKSFFGERGHAKTKIISVRAGNVYGGGDWAKYRILPDAVRAFTHKKTLEIRNPDALRPWQFVLEPLRGYLMACEAVVQDRAREHAWNFGPRDEDTIAVGPLIERFAKHWGSDPQWSTPPQEKTPHEAHTLRLDISRAASELGWRPRVNLDVGLKATAAWYQLHHSNAGPEALRNFSLEQIGNMERLWCES